jgi:hypothetical protein
MRGTENRLEPDRRDHVARDSPVRTIATHSGQFGCQAPRDSCRCLEQPSRECGPQPVAVDAPERDFSTDRSNATMSAPAVGADQHSAGRSRMRSGLRAVVVGELCHSREMDWPLAQPVYSERLLLEPLMVEHSAAMVDVLGDPSPAGTDTIRFWRSPGVVGLPTRGR